MAAWSDLCAAQEKAVTTDTNLQPNDDVPCDACGRQDMCNDTYQHAAMEQLIEGSWHFSSTEPLYYVGWFTTTDEPNPELLEECAVLHKLVTLASNYNL